MTRRTAIALNTLVCLAVAACGTASAPTPSALPTAAATPTPAPEPTSTPQSVAGHRFAFGQSVIVDPALAGLDDRFVNPGAVIEVDGTLHMFANVFSQWPGRVRVPHLTSADGLAWTLDEATPPLDSADFAMADPGIDVSTGFIAEDGTWVLVFETVSSIQPWQVWRMTGPGPAGPWTIDEAPILPAGGTAAFDAKGVHWPSAVWVGDQWAIYYGGFSGPGGGSGVIGAAFSDDGITWTKVRDPVLSATEAWEFGSLDRPRVVVTPAGLVMVYAGLDLQTRGLAVSTDGRSWTKLPGPSIEAADFPVSGGSWDSALLHRNGALEYFLEIGGQTTQIFRATLPWP